MNKYAFIALLLIALVFPSPIFASSAPGVYYGAATDNNFTDFESKAGKGVSLVMLFHYFNAGDFPTAKLDSIRAHGAIPVVSWESYDPGDPNSSWEKIAAGVKDGYITQWARDSQAWGHAYFLRFNWEMNGYWEPFVGQAEYYVPMWKHMHDIFVQNGATNVTWVWCPNVDSYSTRPFDSMYPGTDYVDWVCMDGYNYGTAQSWSSWQSFSSLFRPTYDHLRRLAPDKPIMIGEMGTAETGGSKADWISQMLTSQLPNNFPWVKAIVWFNINKEADWRIESSADAQAAFAQGIASSYYAANVFSEISSPISPLGGLPKPTAKPRPTATLTPVPTITLIPSSSPTLPVIPIPSSSPSANSDRKFPRIPVLLVIAAGIIFLYSFNRKVK